MQDRVPTYPGRVTLTPVAGQANTFDMVLADAPTVQGTPLNKANLLSDATAALLDGASTPDAAFAKLKEFINANATLLSTKAQIATGSYTGTGTYGDSNPCSLTFPFPPKLVLVVVKGTYDTLWRGLFLHGNDAARTEMGTATADNVYLTWTGNSLSWYSNSKYTQLNLKNDVYQYFAIG